MKNNIPYELIARYLAGECNEDEKLKIQEWGQLHPDIMDECTRIWQQTSSEEFNPDVAQALQKVNHRIDTKKKKSSRRLFTLISGAAAIILIVIVSIISVRNHDITQNMHTDLLALQTGVGETLEYQLPDGSKIWLNHSSVLSYPQEFGNVTREIYLEGEAFFEIAPDSNRPFIIHANNTLTQVVGTSFGIKAIKNTGEVLVTVSTGVVNLSVEGKESHIELRQGEQGVCHTIRKKLDKMNVPDPNLLAWKTKILVFKQSSLAEVAGVIESAYQIPVSVDSSMIDLQLTSTFEKLSLDEVLEIIGMTMPIHISKDEKVILFSPDK